LGIVCDITRNGIATRSMLRLSTMPKASGTPIATADMKPVRTESSV
jgi:hypothetical protein